MINYQEMKPRLMFINKMHSKNGKPAGEVFAFIEFDNLEQLKELRDEINAHIKGVETREP